MKFQELLEIVANEPVFETGLLLAGDVDKRDIHRQLSRWARAGRIIKIRRGLFSLAPPYRKAHPHPFLVANRLVRASFVSCQAALAHYAMIPERLYQVTSVTTARPARYDTPLGDFVFRHVKSALFHGYEPVELGNGQDCLLARPEKALLDLVHLQAGSDNLEALRHLRLQNLEQLQLSRLEAMAQRTGSPKLIRASAGIHQLVREDSEGYAAL